MEYSILAAILIGIALFTWYFVFKKTPENTLPSNRKGVFDPISDREITIHWQDNPLPYSLKVVRATVREGSEVSFNCELKLLKDNKPTNGYIVAAALYAVDSKNQTRKLLDFYPTHNMPPKGWYLGVESTNQISAEVPYSKLNPGDDLMLNIKGIQGL